MLLLTAIGGLVGLGLAVAALLEIEFYRWVGDVHGPAPILFFALRRPGQGWVVLEAGIMGRCVAVYR